MNYPLISEYIEAIKSAEDNFKELTNLQPVLGDDGQPVMTGGNFAVVFKMQDIETSKFYALKCFIKDQEGREEAYHQITEELKYVDSPYLVSINYLEKELFVDSMQTEETEFPVLLMDWVEGKTLDKYLRENLDDKFALEMLAYRFSQLAQWLIPQPFAHGDLKPDNILVREDGTLVLVDYDGMYVPAMKGQKARELGSPDFRHPQRTEDDFDEHIDDFPFVSILLSLKCVLFNNGLFRQFCINDGTIFHEPDFRDIANSGVNKHVLGLINNTDIARLYSAFVLLLSDKRLGKDITMLIINDDDQKQFYKVVESQAQWIDDDKYCLSCCLQNGWGCEKNIKQGTELLQQLAEQGERKSQFKLGYCYAHGIGVIRSNEKAVEWYTKSAEQGYAKAQFNLALCYEKGEGTIQNYEKAFEWFAKTAEQGIAVAQNTLGCCYMNGKGVTQDYMVAVEWFAKAAEQGNAKAEYNLGVCNEYGYGIIANIENAKFWYEKAAKSGNSNAKKALESFLLENTN